MTSIAPTSVQRQVALPLSKAVEIAWKSIRLRLRRSLLVTSGIVLAIAFLMAMLTSEAMIDAMRDWTQHGPPAASLDRQRLDATMRAQGVPTSADEIADARLQTRWVLALALMVAFAGVLNAMLMSVTERFREIGTMKCLGALDGFIVKLFLIESVFHAIAGTALGVACGFAASAASMTISYGKLAWINLPVTHLIDGAIVCSIVGIALTVGGSVYPAWRAARMQPVEAMRVET
jgi:putative ABC transport system permease protein